MGNHYEKAIRILANAGTDFRALAYEVAAKNPKAVVDAAARLEVIPKWVRECEELMASNQLVAAIKTCRTATGMGLKEAKDAVEDIYARSRAA